METYAEARIVAETAARAAGEILLSAYGRVSAREKAPGDLVTDADLASQRAIAAILKDAFPDHTLLAEEDGVMPDPDAAFRWIVDPLDGTINFAHGVPLWCISIALEHAGELVVGVVFQPLLRDLFSASKGAGATRNGEPMHVSGTDRLQRSLIVCGMPTNYVADAPRQLAIFDRFSTGTHSVRRTGNSAWNLAMTAAGGFEVCYGSSLYPWDAAAGVVLVREAGGTVTLMDGSPHDLYRNEVLATNGRVHGEAVEAIRTAVNRRPVQAGDGDE
ncbi:MAG: inositol monophosphatase/fructose,6-bisphosphatase family protein [Planctomycetota bacterium]|nr:inositol monophosphatase/fructose,6-bisphosphatase family protein [Planctomycetota bacterium]